MLTYICPAKINIGLHIKGKRPDGYHLLESLFYPAPLFDHLQIDRINPVACEIEIEGMPEAPKTEENLCYKAWELMRRQFPEVKGVRIALQKNIPAGAGLGGGSSNAAYCLLGIQQLYKIDCPLEELAKIGAQIGADVPFFLYQKAMYATGTGTTLNPFEIGFPFEVRLYTPGIHLSTQAVYQNYREKFPDKRPALSKLLRLPINQWKAAISNDLETAACQLHPELASIKDEIYASGALYASMSGSGSAFYGLFQKGTSAKPNLF